MRLPGCKDHNHHQPLAYPRMHEQPDCTIELAFEEHHKDYQNTFRTLRECFYFYSFEDLFISSVLLLRSLSSSPSPGLLPPVPLLHPVICTRRYLAHISQL